MLKPLSARVKRKDTLGALVVSSEGGSVGARQEREGDFPPGIGAPARRALINAGYSSLGQLTAVRETELKQLHGMGPKAIEQLRSALQSRGQSFKSE